MPSQQPPIIPLSQPWPPNYAVPPPNFVPHPQPELSPQPQLVTNRSRLSPINTANDSAVTTESGKEQRPNCATDLKTGEIRDVTHKTYAGALDINRTPEQSNKSISKTETHCMQTKETTTALETDVLLNKVEPEQQGTKSVLLAEDKTHLYKPPMMLQMEKQSSTNEERNCLASKQENALTVNAQSEKRAREETPKRDNSCWRCSEDQQDCTCNIKASRDSPAFSIRFLRPELPLANAIIVWNLRTMVTEQSFRHLIQGCGRIEEMHFFNGDPNGLFRIHAYVRFEDGKDGKKALRVLDEKMFGYARVKADWFTKLLIKP